jgi:hypothetical protein
MDLTLESDIYEPSINDDGDYYDYLPPTSKFKNGLRCPCGSRKDHVFEARSSFAIHIKTQTHQKWVVDMNKNKTNYYSECEKLKEVIMSQKMIIAKMENEIMLYKKELNTKSKTIDILTEQLSYNNTVTTNLLTFD